MALQIRETEPISDDVLSEWKRVASGSFGCVFKATHKQWHFDVAVKIPTSGDNLFLPIEEARLMDIASCEYVLRVYGRYVGNPPGQLSMVEGIVMDFMEMGCLLSLLKKQEQAGTPGPILPWPLAFRCAHEVALGMNFLHSKGIVHNDLKLSNVLLNEELHVKIADFGLSRVSNSVEANRSEGLNVIGGTYKYMPPEAFDLSYKPGRRYDVYSYGILLWAIFSGEEPYPHAPPSLVKMCVPAGQRPKCDKLDQIQLEGLKKLVNLIKRCWEQIPNKRPTFIDCLKDTKEVWLKHKTGISNAVQEVMRRQEVKDSATSSQHSGKNERSVFSPQTSGESLSPVHESVQPQSTDVMDYNRFPQQSALLDGSRARDTNMTQRYQWAEDDFDARRGAARLTLSETSVRGRYIMYHGTTSQNAQLILAEGFRQSSDGVLGPGVYLSRDLEKAKCYPIDHPEHDRVVIKVVVNVGRVKRIDRQRHPLQKTWHDHGYDTAWVPPNCGILPSGLEEDCVWDPRRIQIIGTIKPRDTNMSQRYQWAEDDFDAPRGAARLGLSETFDGQKYVMYHGTTRHNAQLILAEGFRQSSDGVLGPGVYLSRDLEKAKCYPVDHPEHDRVVIKVVVDVGRVKRIDRQRHPLQKTWHDHGYDTAWVPPNCGILPSGLEEDCVWDPRRIQIINTIKPQPVQYGAYGYM